MKWDQKKERKKNRLRMNRNKIQQQRLPPRQVQQVQQVQHNDSIHLNQSSHQVNQVNQIQQQRQPKIAPVTDQGTRPWKTGPQKGPKTKGSRIGKSIVIQTVSDFICLIQNDENAIIFGHSKRSKSSKRLKKVFDEFSIGVHQSNCESKNKCFICCTADYDEIATDPNIKGMFKSIPMILLKIGSTSTQKSIVNRWTFVDFTLPQLCRTAAKFFNDSSLVPLHPDPPKPLKDCQFVLIHDQDKPLIPRFVKLPVPMDGDMVSACLSILKSNPNIAQRFALINVRQIGLSFLPLPSLYDRRTKNFFRHHKVIEFLLSLVQKQPQIK